MIGKVMITGVNGFIGSHIGQLLIENGYEIIGVAIEEICTHSGINHYEKIDITDVLGMRRLFEKYKPDYVIHLAAIVHKQSMIASYEDFYKVNYLASKSIFENCIKYNVKKLLFASTVEVYDLSQNSKITELSPTNPQSDYGKTKLMAEESLKTLAHGTDLDYAIMRFAPVYGKDFRLNVDRRIFLKKNKLMYYFGKGDYFYNMCSIHNIKDFVLKYMELSKETQGVFNISDSEMSPIRELIVLQKSLTGGIVIKMPYHLTYRIIAIIEWFFMKIGKNSILSIYNFKKIFKCTIFDNHHMIEVTGKLKWDIKSTLY